MFNRNSTDDLFYYIPIAKQRKKKDRCLIIEDQKYPFHIHREGSSTFDYFNDINKNKYKFPKLKPSFLTKKERHKIILDSIEKNNMIEKSTINPIYKLRLSNSCELFHKLGQTYMNDKNCLKEINNEKFIFENNNIYSNSSNNINNINEETDKDTHFKTIFFNKTNTLSKFNNLTIKQSLSSDKSKFRNNNNNNNIIQNYDYYKDTDKNNTNTNNKNLKGISKYYINFLYNKIFPKFFVEHNIKYNVVDNKFNIFYAENERQFKENLIKRNNFLKLKGRPVKKMCINTLYVSDKLKDVKRKIGFLKGVTDYSFPSIILQKIKCKNKLYQLNKKKKTFYLPYEEVEKEDDKINQIKNKILSETILIENEKENGKKTEYKE